MKSFPDWRDASTYPNEKSYIEAHRLKDDRLYTSKAWAWQFLRRNPAYQADYIELRRSGKRNTGRDLAQKYGLTMMLPYTDEAPDLIPFQMTLALPQFSGESIKRNLPKLRDSELALVFDLTLPIKEQFALAKAQIAQEIQFRKLPSFPTKRKRKQEFIRYLRLIDAKQCKTSSQTIASQLIAEGVYRAKYRSGDNYYAGQSLVEQDWYVAKRLMETGYLAIAYS